MSEVKVNKITPTTNCGTVTLGDSGDTVAIPCGVTLSNSGSITNSGTITNTGTISGGTITGTIDNQVNWDTTAKTSGFTAVAGNGYFVNTTSAAITVTLPATPSAGDLVGIKDYANTANTNNIIIDRNGSNIQGTANNFTISVAGTSITLIYVDGTQGWVSTGAAKASDITEDIKYVTATGGSTTTSGDYKIHTFTGPGTFTVSCAGNPAGSSTVEYLIVAGGGGGGPSGPGNNGGGGGAGGYTVCSALPVSVTGYPITVGAGGSSGGGASSPGSNSVALAITAGYGGFGRTAGCGAGGPAPLGSGGGGASPAGAGGTGGPQGNPGGTASPGGGTNAGGGGGSGSAGNPGCAGGSGGGSTSNSISGSPVAYAAGGKGGTSCGSPGTPGSANTGDGGTGAAKGAIRCGGAGGSGIVIIKYKFQN